LRCLAGQLFICGSTALRLRALRPQLKRDPLGSRPLLDATSLFKKIFQPLPVRFYELFVGLIALIVGAALIYLGGRASWIMEAPIVLRAPNGGSVPLVWGLVPG